MAVELIGVEARADGRSANDPRALDYHRRHAAYRLAEAILQRAKHRQREGDERDMPGTIYHQWTIGVEVDGAQIDAIQAAIDKGIGDRVNAILSAYEKRLAGWAVRSPDVSKADALLFLTEAIAATVRK